MKHVCDNTSLDNEEQEERDRYLKKHRPSWTRIPHEHVETALNTNIIPHIWKLAYIVPVQNLNKDIDRSTSYRLISILSVIATTLEKSLLPNITANIPNTPTQHGYKTQHFTVTALHTLNNSVAKGFNQPAVDTINIHTLIGNLLQTNIPDTIIKFISQTTSRDAKPRQHKK